MLVKKKMAPREPKPSTVKRLFAFSHNQCAFPGCDLPLVEHSGVVTGIICHIKARNKGGPRFDAKQTAEGRHAFDNLILLCGRHSKIIDSQPKTYPVELLQEIKEIHERDSVIEINQKDAKAAELLLAEYRMIYIAPGSSVSVNSAGTIHADTVKVEGDKKLPKFTAPVGSIASSLSHRNYVKHLIDRYHEFASKQPGRGNFSYPAFYAKIKKIFGAKWDMIHLDRFADFCEFLQDRIDRTRLGQINRSKGQPNYSTFDPYTVKYGTPRNKLKD